MSQEDAMNGHFAIALAHDHHQQLRRDADGYRLARQASARRRTAAGTNDATTTGWNRWRQGRSGRGDAPTRSLAPNGVRSPLPAS
jgi:hypothetical protein